MALALARKYRPRRFSDLLVQDHVAAVLRGAVVKNRVGHGYLLTGPRGVGKTTAARILAMALNCERKGQAEPAGEPCGECENCQRIWSGVGRVSTWSRSTPPATAAWTMPATCASAPCTPPPRRATTRSTSWTRRTCSRARRGTRCSRSSRSRRPGVVFVFATTEPQKIAQHRRAGALPAAAVRFPPHRARRHPRPAPRRARARADRGRRGRADPDRPPGRRRHARRPVGARPVPVLRRGRGHRRAGARGARPGGGRGLRRAARSVVGAGRRRASSALVDGWWRPGPTWSSSWAGPAEMLRALLMLAGRRRARGAHRGACSQAWSSIAGRLAAGRSAPDAAGCWPRSRPAIRRSGNPRLVVETLLLRWAMMDRTVDLEAVLAGRARPAAPAAAGPARRTRHGAGAGAQRAERAASAGADARRAGGARRRAAPSRPDRVEFTLEAWSAAWPELVGGGRGSRAASWARRWPPPRRLAAERPAR